jgi:tryptophan-rich sensory protein
MTSESRTHWAGLAGWIALCFATAAVGAAASWDARAFYAQLVRPPWAPPAAVFGPVWSVLYLLMAIAAWRVWWTPSPAARSALTIFIVQLALNALWSWLFFGWHFGVGSVIEIAVLWLLIAATLAMFWRIDRTAGALLVPYFAWVTFASVLCYAIWRANPTLLR